MKKTCPKPDTYFLRTNRWIRSLVVGMIAALCPDLYAVWANQENETREVVLPLAISEFRQQLWAKKPAGQTFDLIVSDSTVTETLRWALAEKPQIPFSDPEVRLRPGGLSASAWADVLGQSIRVSGAASVSLSSGSPQFTIESLEVAGVEAPEVVREAVLGALNLAREYFDASKFPLDLTVLEIEQGAARVAGTFRRLKKSHGATN